MKDRLKVSLATESDYKKQVRLIHDIIDLSEDKSKRFMKGYPRP